MAAATENGTDIHIAGNQNFQNTEMASDNSPEKWLDSKCPPNSGVQQKNLKGARDSHCDSHLKRIPSIRVQSGVGEEEGEHVRVVV